MLIFIRKEFGHPSFSRTPSGIVQIEFEQEEIPLVGNILRPAYNVKYVLKSHPHRTADKNCPMPPGGQHVVFWNPRNGVLSSIQLPLASQREDPSYRAREWKVLPRHPPGPLHRQRSANARSSEVKFRFPSPPLQRRNQTHTAGS